MTIIIIITTRLRLKNPSTHLADGCLNDLLKREMALVQKLRQHSFLLLSPSSSSVLILAASPCLFISPPLPVSGLHSIKLYEQQGKLPPNFYIYMKSYFFCPLLPPFFKHICTNLDKKEQQPSHPVPKTEDLSKGSLTFT